MSKNDTILSIVYNTLISSHIDLQQWQGVFKAVAGVPSPDPYELWVSTTTEEFPSNYMNTCQHPTPSGVNGTHCKTFSALDWDKLDIEEV